MLLRKQTSLYHKFVLRLNFPLGALLQEISSFLSFSPVYSTRPALPYCLASNARNSEKEGQEYPFSSLPSNTGTMMIIYYTSTASKSTSSPKLWNDLFVLCSLNPNININDKISKVNKLQLFNIQKPIPCWAIQSIKYGLQKKKKEEEARIRRWGEEELGSGREVGCSKSFSRLPSH